MRRSRWPSSPWHHATRPGRGVRHRGGPSALDATRGALRRADLCDGEGASGGSHGGGPGPYSVPGDLIGAHVEVRADRALGRISHRGAVVRVSIPARSQGDASPTPPTCRPSGPRMPCGTSSTCAPSPTARPSHRSRPRGAVRHEPALNQAASGLSALGSGASRWTRPGRRRLLACIRSRGHRREADRAHPGTSCRTSSATARYHRTGLSPVRARSRSLRGRGSESTSPGYPTISRTGLRSQPSIRVFARSSRRAPMSAPTSVISAKRRGLLRRLKLGKVLGTGIRTHTARLHPTMTLEPWDDTAAVTYNPALFLELTTLRFLDDAAYAGSGSRRGRRDPLSATTVADA